MTADTSISNHIELEPDNAARLANLCGRLDEHLRQIENHLGVKITHRGNSFKITGDEAAVNATSSALSHLYSETATGETLNPNAIHLALGETSQALSGDADTTAETTNSVFIRTPKSSVKPRSPHQREYVESIRRHDINFGIGPAGTGKTYLAVACAVEALVSERVNRLLLVRPAVEAGGATIWEGTRALALTPGRVVTYRGTDTADVVLRATEGFTARLPGHRRDWLPLNSAQIVTDPLPPDLTGLTRPR